MGRSRRTDSPALACPGRWLSCNEEREIASADFCWGAKATYSVLYSVTSVYEIPNCGLSHPWRQGEPRGQTKVQRSDSVPCPVTSLYEDPGPAENPGTIGHWAASLPSFLFFLRLSSPPAGNTAAFHRTYAAAREHTAGCNISTEAKTCRAGCHENQVGEWH